MKELFLLKLGEIVLKGQNRRVFEDKLKTVTRRRMTKFGEFKISIVQSTLYVEPLTDDCDLDGAWEACGTILLNRRWRMGGMRGSTVRRTSSASSLVMHRAGSTMARLEEASSTIMSPVSI